MSSVCFLVEPVCRKNISVTINSKDTWRNARTSSASARTLSPCRSPSNSKLHPQGSLVLTIGLTVARESHQREESRSEGILRVSIAGNLCEGLREVCAREY